MAPRQGVPASDHPRSRGVYGRAPAFDGEGGGSSPLARGLPMGPSRSARSGRIIPARAGFTLGTAAEDHRAQDHPRSRGVYRWPGARGRSWDGSSPLARGLRIEPGFIGGASGIIPARAGFTRIRGLCFSPWRDHPRSRGVYCYPYSAIELTTGSSPLARGLRHGWVAPAGGEGIIPARAGFTRPGLRRPLRPPDHPRSRGVYTCGSLESQRTRTLPDPCCLHCRPRARSAELR